MVTHILQTFTHNNMIIYKLTTNLNQLNINHYQGRCLHINSRYYNMYIVRILRIFQKLLILFY